MLTDLAVAIADGATAISDLRVLADQPELFGQVASVPTAWRALEAIGETTLQRIAHARAEARRQAWAAGMDPGFYVIDIDGVLIDTDSVKENTAANYKHRWGFSPLIASLDATGEALAALLRPGNAGSGTAADHITVLQASLAQLPLDPAARQVIVRTDAGGTSQEFAAHCRERQVRFIGGIALRDTVGAVIVGLPETAWQQAISADGASLRETGEVAEITHLIPAQRLAGWPAGTRMLVRREQPHAGAQLQITDEDGYRFQVLVTDLPDTDLPFLEALYRGRGRMECRIRDAKDTGLANLPSHSFAINTAWLALQMIATDLLAWLRHLCLDRDLAAAEPKRLRYTLLHTAGVLVHSGRRTRLRLAANWPWTPDLISAFSRLPGWAPG